MTGISVALFSGKAASPDSDKSSQGTPVRTQREIANAYGKLPLNFVANHGQTNHRVRFNARGVGYNLFLTANEAVLALSSVSTCQSEVESQPGSARDDESRVVRMQLLGVNRSARINGVDKLPGKLNYFIGKNPDKWRKNIPTYARVRYRQVYPGIDLIYHGNQGQLEYDFVIAPGASHRQIKLRFVGMRKTTLDAEGNLVLSMDGGDLYQHKPVAYQEVNGERREVSVSYKLHGDKVTFEAGGYDKNLPLVIDPVFVYSSFLGGTSSEQGLGIAVDAQGSAYLTGRTNSTDFPIAGAAQGANGSVSDAFVVKINPSGTALVYGTYLGGNGDDIGNAIAVDAQGSAYVVGSTGSGSFPRTVGAAQVTKDGSLDGFVTKLSASGSSLVYSTFLGGDNTDIAFGVAVDASGRAHVTGRTDSTRFLIPFPTPRHGNPLYKSSDSAGHWSPSATDLTDSTVNALAFNPANSNTLYAGSNIGVFKSVDAGAHWTLTGIARPSTAPGFTQSVAVDPSNPSIIYAGTSAGVYKSTDGGALYDEKNSGLIIPFINALAIDPSAPATLYAGGILDMYKSTNGGDAWFTIDNGLDSSVQVTKVVIDPTNPAIIYIGTFSGMYKSTNGGALWSPINSGLLIGLPITALTIDPTNPATLYVGYSGALFKTTNGGATWTSSSTGLTITVDGQSFTPAVRALTVDPVTPANVYAATVSGGIFKSTDGGANWSQSNVGFLNRNANAIAISPSNSSVLYAGTAIGSDAFAVRLNASGTALEYLMNFGGHENDESRSVALDAVGNAYVVGTTGSQDFPLLNPFQLALGGFSDSFVTKINASGTGFVYSTYLGGTSAEQGRAIALKDGSAYVTGQTSSANFPLVNPFKGSLATFDTDAFVTKVNSTGVGLDFSTYLGGTGQDQGLGIAVGTDGGVYVTGATGSPDFPTLSAPQPSPGSVFTNDAFVTKLNPAGMALVYSSYLGGVGSDQGNGIAVDSVGNAYIIGTTSSANFPTVSPFQPTLKGSDAFVTKIGVSAEVSITKTDSRDPVMVNNPLSYAVKATNNGPSPATGVQVTDALPVGLTFVSATSTQGSCAFNAGTVTCSVGSLSASASATITITVTPTTAVTLNNTAAVTASEPDPVAANNSATQATRVSTLPSINGRVRDSNSNGVSGVLVTLNGPQSATTQTDSDGFYQFADLPVGGNYTLTPTKTNLSFEPPAQTFNSLSADQTADFVASTCTYSLSPVTASFSSNGGTGVVNVNSLNGCPWNAVSSANWITITAGSPGVGSGSVSYTVGPTTVPRAGRLTIAGKSFPIYQEVNSCAAPTFSVASYNLSSSPTIARSADLNGDGYSDVLMATNGLSGAGIAASVMLNNGTGAFTSSSFDTGLGAPQGYILADFNNDGRPDLAGTDYNTPFVRILFNNGSGGFGQSSVNIPFDSQGQSALTGPVFSSDLNHDGNADLLVSTYNNKTQILLGNGSGGFTQIAPVLMPTFALIDTADVNNDGNPDLLLGAGSSSTPLGVMLGNGSGGFGALIGSAGIDSATFIHTLGDFDGDGLLDIVLPTSISTSSFTGFAMMSGDGLGHFVTKSTYSVSNSGLMTTGDFNSDGKADVAFSSDSTKVIVLLGDGIGGFASSIVTDTGGQSQFPGNGGLVAADFNGDLRPDLAVANYTLGAHVLRNNCAAAPAISGRITDSRNTGSLEGVAITIGSGQVIANTHTDSGGNYFIGNLTAGGNYQVVPTKDNFRFSPASISISNLSGTQTANFVGTPTTVQFTQFHYLVEEFNVSVQINVSRSGDLSGETTVDYATVNGTASDRSDFTAAVGTLHFGSGESLKSFNVLFTDDALVEGFESMRLVLSNPRGALLSTSDVLLEIRDNDFAPGAQNPIADSQFFVRQHYHDFLNREPDSGGLSFWVDQIEGCGGDINCREVRRINVSAAFFLSIEFQETGYLSYRMYNAAYGNATSPNVPGTVPIIRLNEFVPDSQQIGRGVQVGIGNWQQQLEENKAAYALAFVLRQRFVTAYPLSLTADQFVTQLDQTAGNVLSAAEKAQLVALLGMTPGDAAKRASVVRAVAEDSDLRQRELNRAFVLMEYYGYLRRNPDDPQDTDFRGWKFWLDKLSQFNGNFVNAEMVKSFLLAGEYRQRFGAP
ncbi:MAG: SBBP repeat-containing protein [Pyrinomonadaceae bacterium]|nr:SBBP repeat-containing protein [Pyrinomonadaceae bacterium]